VFYPFTSCPSFLKTTASFFFTDVAIFITVIPAKAGIQHTLQFESARMMVLLYGFPPSRE
jgi:hypothetical protein